MIQNFKKKDHDDYDKYLQSYCTAENCQGAFFTFTKKMIEKVGYFDENNFKIRGHSHIDFTLRCCRNGFNRIDKLWDLINSEDYLELNNDDYISSFVKLPLFLRENHKVDIYELDRRYNLIKDENKLYYDCEFDIF